MRIKITKCSHKIFWYRDYVGYTFNVVILNGTGLYTVDHQSLVFKDKPILKKDCILLDDDIGPVKWVRTLDF